MNRLLSQRLFLRDGLAKTARFSPLYLYGILRIPKNALFSPLHRFAARSECKDPPLENPQGFFTSPVYAIQPVGWHVLRKRGGKQEREGKERKREREREAETREEKRTRGGNQGREGKERKSEREKREEKRREER